MNEDHAKQACEAYANIKSALVAIEKIRDSKFRRTIVFNVHGKVKDDYGSPSEILMTTDTTHPSLQAEIVEFALKRRIETLQERINQYGRRLAQLGFQKPEECQ